MLSRAPIPKTRQSPRPDRSRDKPKHGSLISKVGLAAGSIVIAYLLVLLVSKGIAWRIGIRDREFRYENALGMWRSDPVTGFVNRSDYSEYCFGNVLVATDKHGFRASAANSDRLEVSATKPPAATRIIGVGDSVMWGTSVSQANSLLGQLRTRLETELDRVEVINAGVVGYSTLQEYLLLKNQLIRFSPDIVLVNFCENDLLPTEDPFQSVRTVYLQYLRRCLADPQLSFDQSERDAIRELIWVFESPAPVHSTMGRTSIACRVMATRLFLQLPIEAMIQLGSEQDFELVYLLIPPREEHPGYAHLSAVVRTTLEASQTPYLDLSGTLRNSGQLASEPPIRPSGSGFLSSLANQLVPDLVAVVRLRQIEGVQRQRMYVDFVHPSKRGNEAIADEVADFLMPLIED